MYRSFKLSVHALLLVSTPSFLVYPQHISYANEKTPYDSSSPVSYDEIIQLIDALETGELEKTYSPADLDRVNQCLAILALEGALPDEEEFLHLQEDIDALLNDDEPFFQYAVSLGYPGEYMLIPSFCNEQYNILLCKSWLSKKWDKAKKFLKKHKKEIIVGAVVIVAAAAVVIAVSAVSSASAAAAVAAASSQTKSDKSISSIQKPSNSQLVSFKEQIVQEQFFPNEDPAMTGNSLSWEEIGRIVGPLFAHDSLNQQWPSNAPPEMVLGHDEINRLFTAHEVSISQTIPFNVLSHQMIGEQALIRGYTHQAIDCFGKAIDLNPLQPLPYLQRSTSYFQEKQYDASFADFQKYVVTSKEPSSNVLEFSKGFATGLPKGIYESGEGIILFMAELVTHPIQTATQVWDAMNVLCQLAKQDDWAAVGKFFAPEIAQLLTDWESIPADKRGELAGYALGKYGADIGLPAAMAKIASKSVKSVQELATAYKNLKYADSTLVLETAAGLGNSAKVAEILEAGQQTALLADELGFTPAQMGQLKQAGQLEKTVINHYDHLSTSVQESIQQHKYARDVLKVHAKIPLPEEQVRAYIHGTGMPTFPRPKSIPENFLVMITDKGAGMEYVHPTNTHIRIRVMPGKLHSPFPYQQKPYVIHKVEGKGLDKFGNRIALDAPEAHIPIEEFIYINIK